MPPATQERFRKVERLRIPGELHAIRYSDLHLRLNAPGSGRMTMLNVDEVRQLRDWLNATLPEEITDPTPCWCPYCGEPHGVHQSKEKP